MARIVGYIASSLDGYIADKDEGLKWLMERKDVDLAEFDYTLFVKRIRTVVMGRTTYEWMARQNMEWPYQDQRSIIVTAKAIDTGFGNVEVRSDVDALVRDSGLSTTATSGCSAAASCRWRSSSAARSMRSRSI